MSKQKELDKQRKMKEAKQFSSKIKINIIVNDF